MAVSSASELSDGEDGVDRKSQIAEWDTECRDY